MIVVRSMVEKDGSAKGIVFSQFTSFLDISRFEYTQMNKSNDNGWFRISTANPEGTRWTGKCWYVYNLLKYEFDIPITHPATAPELELPQLDGKTQKMYKRGEDLLDSAFQAALGQELDFDECIDYIDEATRSGGGVLVHCFVGRFRSPYIPGNL